MAFDSNYSEGVFSRSAAMRGRIGTAGGNITNSLGAQPGNSNTVGGGNQVIPTSSDIDGRSQLDSPFSVNNIPDDPKAYVSSDKSEVLVPLTSGRKLSEIGNPAGFSVSGQTGIMQAGGSFGGMDITR